MNSKRPLQFWLILIFLYVPVPVPVTQAQEEDAYQITVTQVDNSAYPQVTIYVRIIDETGQLVSGLVQDQFEVMEEGEVVTLMGYDPSVMDGVTTVLTIDRSGSMNEDSKLQGAQNAASSYVDNIREQDQVAIVVFHEQVEVVQPFSNDHALLHQQIEGITTGDCTAIYDGLYESVELVKAGYGRTIILLITDGMDCREGVFPSDLGSQHTLDESINHANSVGIPVHAVGLGDRNSFFWEIGSGIDEEKLQRISSETGGNYHYAPTAAELTALYESIAIETQQEYVLTYESPRPFYDGTRRDIQVNVLGSVGSSTYLESHLLFIQSTTTIGLTALIPLLLLLLVPNVVVYFSRVHKPSLPLPTPSRLPLAFTTCPHCGQQLRHGQKFCASCGKSAIRSVPPPPQSYCSYCSQPIRAHSKFCSGCGRAA